MTIISPHLCCFTAFRTDGDYHSSDCRYADLSIDEKIAAVEKAVSEFRVVSPTKTEPTS
jgi:hypothetical protein